MKKIMLGILIPAVAYGITKDQFEDVARKDFETKFGRVKLTLEKENIDTQSGLAKIYCNLSSVKLDDFFSNELAKKSADTFYDEIKNSSEFKQIVEHIKKAYTTDAFEQHSYEYIKFVVTKARVFISKDCIGIIWPEESSDENDRRWLMIDDPRPYLLNSNKEFSKACENTVMGVNAAISLLMQELYAMKED